jgi:8-oxo-dGTP diphosphatase
MTADKALLVVLAAVIERDDLILVAQRPAGTHLGGHWEFPGGKMEPGETHIQCLEREIREELGAVVEVGREVLATRCEYPDRIVALHFRCCVLQGAPTPMLGQPMRWVPRSELHTLRFPPADRELVNLLVSGQLRCGTDARG